MAGKNLFGKFCLVAVFALIPSSFAASHAYGQVATAPDLNEIRITNRAQCAVDSEAPTDTAFLILDGYNAGKLGNSLAKNLGLDATETSQETMKEFRLSLTHMSLVIFNKLMNGRLPLLPSNINEKTPLKNYAELVKLCKDKVYCADLSSYLDKLWALSEDSDVLPGAPDWKVIDNFSKNNFYPGRGALRVGCYYLKRFSPLQGQLHNTMVDKATLEEMAVAYLEKGKYIGDCYSTDPTLDSRNAALQIDLKVGAPAAWDKYGFDFWNSAKIYLSWAWRNTNIAQQMSPRFGEAYKSLALEESMMLIPNGCKSITKPSCDSEHLAINSLRELAKQDVREAEQNAQVPQSIEKNMLERGGRSVNDDFLNTRGYMTANEWVDNFRKNYVQTRGSMKNKLQASVQFMNILADTMSAQQLVEYVKPLALAKNQNSLRRDELYYLCTEARLAGDKRLDFLKTDIQNIGELKSMTKALELSKRSMPEMIQYFDAVSAAVLPLCDSLEKTNVWQVADYTVNKKGFFPWAKEVLSIKMVDPEDTTPAYTPQIYGAPLLVWNASLAANSDNIICASGIDCTRNVIKAMVDFYSVAEYAEAFLPVSSEAVSPNVFNPYAELKACQMYDPWYQTKRANRRFMADLASTALFGWNPLPMYIDTDYTPPKVASFNQMVQNGVIKFAPNVEKSKMVASMVADFGPLTGAPCAVAISPNAKAFDFLAFDGISVNYCDSKKTNGGTASSANNFTPNPEKARSYCGGCTLNFVGVSSAASYAAISSFNPIKLGVYLFRAVHRFVTAKEDTVNVPKTYTVDLAKVAEVYRKYGSIPKDCVNQLGKGLKCFKNICEAHAANYFEKVTGGTASLVHLEDPEIPERRMKYYQYYKTAWVKSSLCKGEAFFKIGCDEKGDNFWTHPDTTISGIGNCKNFFERRK
jgi:hypothetical protein